MDLVAIEAPAARITGSRKAPEFFDTPFRIVGPSQLLKVLADQLVEALAEGLGSLSSAFDGLFVDR